MFTHLDHILILYALTLIFGAAIISTVAIRKWRKSTQALLPTLKEVFEEDIAIEEKEEDVMDDLIADLFVGHLTGHVIGLIGNSYIEYNYYRHLVDLIYSRFILSDIDTVMDIHAFIQGTTAEIDKISSVGVQRQLRDRLRLITSGVTQTSHYRNSGVVDIEDIYNAMTQSFNIIRHYDITGIKSQ